MVVGVGLTCERGAAAFSPERRMTIFHLVFAIPSLLVIVRWLWPLSLPFWGKGGIALLLLVVSQYHLWGRLSSGSVFAPEFPRAIVILFNWAFGAIVILLVLQVLLDLGTFAAMLVRQGSVGVPDGLRYAIAGAAALISAIGVVNATRVPPLNDIAVEIRGLPAAFEGYRLLQLTDLHISQLFPATWSQAVVDRANASGVDLIVVTGDFIDGSVEMRRDDVLTRITLHAAR